MDIQTSTTKGRRGRIGLVTISHLVGIMVGVGGIICLERLIPTGAEGGWLTRIYVGALFAVTVVANLILLICALFKRGISILAVVFRLIAVSAPILLVIWRLLRGR